MNENLKFLAQICGISLIILLGVILTVSLLGKANLNLSIISGYLVSLINTLFAFFSLKWAFYKSNKAFFLVVIGGMGIRFLILGAALFIVWKFITIPFVGFVVSLVGFYLPLQIFEIKLIQKQLTRRKAAV